MSPGRSPPGAGNSWRWRLENLLLSNWYGNPGLLSTLLLPIAWLYRLIVIHRMKQRIVPGFSVPGRPAALVVVVGNITVGGTGKTPLLLAMATACMARGLRIALISRGYGGSHARKTIQPRWVTVDDVASVTGDEPLLLARELSRQAGSAAPMVMIGRSRDLALQKILADCSAAQALPDVIFSDDGLQHYALPRDIEYVVVDSARAFGNGRLLPAGPLREPVARLALCDCVVVNGMPASRKNLVPGIEHQRIVGMRVSIGAIRPLAGDANRATGNTTGDSLLDSASAVIAIAALGNPGRFFDSVRNYLAGRGIDKPLHCRGFPDHHAYTIDDFVRLHRELGAADDAIFLVTGKDAVKCAQFAASLPLRCLVADAQVEFDEALLDPLLQGLANLQEWRKQHAIELTREVKA